MLGALKTYAKNFISAYDYYWYFAKWPMLAVDAKKRSSAVSLMLAVDSEAVKTYDENGKLVVQTINSLLKDKKGNITYCLRTALSELNKPDHTAQSYQAALENLKRNIDYLQGSIQYIREIPWNPKHVYSDGGMRQRGGTIVARNATYKLEPYLNALNAFYDKATDTSGQFSSQEIQSEFSAVYNNFDATIEHLKSYTRLTSSKGNGAAIKDSYIGGRLGFTAWLREWDMGFIEREVKESDRLEAAQNFQRDAHDQSLPSHERQATNQDALFHFYPGERVKPNYNHPEVPRTGHQKWIEGPEARLKNINDETLSKAIIASMEEMLRDDDIDGAYEAFKWRMMMYSENDEDEVDGTKKANRVGGIPATFKNYLNEHMRTLKETHEDTYPWTNEIYNTLVDIWNVQENFSGANVVRSNWRKMIEFMRVKWRYPGDRKSERTSTAGNEHRNTLQKIHGAFGAAFKGTRFEKLIPARYHGEGENYHNLWMLHKLPTTLWTHSLKHGYNYGKAIGGSMWNHKTLTAGVGAAAYGTALYTAPAATWGATTAVASSTVSSIIAYTPTVISAGGTAFSYGAATAGVVFSPIGAAALVAGVGLYAGMKVRNHIKQKALMSEPDPDQATAQGVENAALNAGPQPDVAFTPPVQPQTRTGPPDVNQQFDTAGAGTAAQTGQTAFDRAAGLFEQLARELRQIRSELGLDDNGPELTPGL